MNQIKENKELIIEYFNAISGVEKTPELCDKYMQDDPLKDHIMFFDTIFPCYEIFADEITAEGDRVVVRARIKGRHEGEFNGIPPTNRIVDFPFAVNYTVIDRLIVDHWLIADQTVLMEQLGVGQKDPVASE